MSSVLGAYFATFDSKDRFHCHATKKINWKRLIYKQFVQVSGLRDQQSLSYLPKRCTHLCRASYGDAILVYIWSSLFPQKLFLFTRELAYMRINISSDT